MNKNVLITGCSGFIGSHIARKLASKFNVFGIDNLSNYYDVNLKLARNHFLLSNINFSKQDITDLRGLKNYFKKKNFSYVIHLAAQAGVRYSFLDPHSYINTNVLGSHNLLEILKELDIEHLIMASTSSVYGHRKQKTPFKENDATSTPISLYASTKKNMEILAHNYSYNFKIPITIVRFFTVYGPWGRPDMALFKFTNSALNGKSIQVFNHGEMWRDFTYIDDLTECIDRLLMLPPSSKKQKESNNKNNLAPIRTVNIGNSNPIKLTSFIKTLEDVIGKKIVKCNLPIQVGDVPFTHSDTTLLKSLINFQPSTSIKYGITEFCHWYNDYYKNKYYLKFK